MALITLADLYDKWQKVSDWVTGVDTVSAPKVKLTDGTDTLLVNADGSINTVLTGRKTSYTTIINAASIASGGNTTITPITVTGYSKGRVVVQAVGNVGIYVEAYSKAGVRIGLGSARIAAATGAYQYVRDFDINGLESIAVYAEDASGATNTVTIDLALMP